MFRPNGSSTGGRAAERQGPGGKLGARHERTAIRVRGGRLMAGRAAPLASAPARRVAEAGAGRDTAAAADDTAAGHIPEAPDRDAATAADGDTGAVRRRRSWL